MFCFLISFLMAVIVFFALDYAFDFDSYIERFRRFLIKFFKRVFK